MHHSPAARRKTFAHASLSTACRKTFADDFPAACRKTVAYAHFPRNEAQNTALTIHVAKGERIVPDN
jgi:hypothetical protein